jgi:5-hydroxyisourate hydrolase
MSVKTSPITTHVLDTALGRPAAGMGVVLERQAGSAWSELGRGVTDADGRNRSLWAGELSAGVYRLTFATGAYFASQSVVGFFPEVAIVFRVDETRSHYHVPLLLSPFGYSTYRGS